MFIPAAETNTRDRNASTEPGFVQLQQDLLGYPDQSTTRSLTPSEPTEPLSVSVEPLGDRYALIQLPADADAALQAAVQERLQQSYIESTLPVLSRANGEDTIVLPNEILLSFEPGTPASQVTLTLNRYGLEVVRPLRFSRDLYLVKSRNGEGLEVLAIANQLNGVAGIQAATPNFVQTIAYDTLSSAMA
ncbi:MAG: peptidase S8, partial [Cyanobacteria bacterium P01_H01_bin.152]